MKEEEAIYLKGNKIYSHKLKHAIVDGVFKGNLFYAEGEFRTPFVDPTFEHFFDDLCVWWN